jgi:hypothetical protein
MREDGCSERDSTLQGMCHEGDVPHVRMPWGTSSGSKILEKLGFRLAKA